MMQLWMVKSYSVFLQTLDSCFLFVGVLHPPAPQQPILKMGTQVNNTPKIPIVQSLAITACTIIAMPKPNLINLIKFQLPYIACFMKTDLIILIVQYK